jgi:predicted lipoprotein with Yx(FWY)xxD motif
LTSNSVSRTRRGLATRTAVALAVAGSLTSVAVGVSAAQAAPAVTNKAVVVHVVTRHPFGKMLATVRGRSLYILPSGTCTGACLGIWPPLLMPRGTKFPRGTHCLATVRFGHRLQVVYRKKRLYLFSGDTGTSVNGNNVGGFKVAKFKTGACPM